MLNEKITELEMEPVASSSSARVFDGIFSVKEGNIRITPDKKWVSVIDVISVIGGQKNPRDVWKVIYENHKKLFVGKTDTKEFPGKGNSKVICVNAEGLVLLINQIPGKDADAFRLVEAKVLVRYLGGDLSLIEEIKAIDQLHQENPENPAQIFREDPTVQQNLLHFSQDQLNNSRILITHFGDKKNLFYILMFEYEGKTYVKFGIIRNVREFHERVTEHQNEWGDICFIQVFQCTDPESVEKEFKQSSLFTMNKCKIPCKNKPNSFHTEIIKISESVTCDMIIQKALKLAGKRILDPPPTYDNCDSDINLGLNLEREKTAQIKAQVENVTKQKELEIEKMKLEFEIMKWKATQVPIVQSQPVPIPQVPIVQSQPVSLPVPIPQVPIVQSQPVSLPVPIPQTGRYQLKSVPDNISGYKNIKYQKSSGKYFYSITIEGKVYNDAYSKDLEFPKNAFIEFMTSRMQM